MKKLNSKNNFKAGGTPVSLKNSGYRARKNKPPA
jgi:hypothetical protein